MQYTNKFTRRQALQGTLAVAAAGLGNLAFPYLGQAAPPSIRLGVLLPFSGGMELFGQQGIQGIKLLMSEVNAAGGLLDGRKLDIIIADNKSDPKVCVERVTQLIQRDKVHAVIGPIASALRDAIKPTIERLKTPLLYATDYEGGVCSPWVACYSALPEHYVYPLVPFMMKEYGDQVYLFGADYSWPQRMNVAIKDTVLKNGGTVLKEEYTPFGVKDFSATLSKLKDSGAKIVLLTLPGADGVTFIKQFHAAGLKKTCKLGFFGFNENYFPGLTVDEAEGVMCIVHYTPSLDSPESNAFVAKQKKMFGDRVTISYYADSHYGICRFFCDAIQRAGSDDKEQIMQNMAGSTMVGNGEVVMRASDRHVDLNMLICEVKNKKLNIIQNVGKIIAPSQCG